jgi:ferredoxin
MKITKPLRPGNATLTVKVNEQRCQGHARCKAIAPELFEFDEFGYARVIRHGTVPSELNKKARLAEANCPEGAIEIFKRGEVFA